MKRISLKYVMCAMALSAFLGGCGEKAGSQFTVQGEVKGADGKVIYLEALTVDDGIQVLDSAKLASDGTYQFTATDTTACPELYRLRIEGQILNFCVDSTETIRIDAEWPNAAFNYKVEGSGSSDTIRILSQKFTQLQQDLQRMSENRNFTLAEREENNRALIAAYKDSVKINYIQDHYGSASSYFALFQAIYNQCIWDLEGDASDVRWALAVANAWNERWPNSLRTQYLRQIVLRGRSMTHRPKVDLGDKVREVSLFDMTYPDISGRDRSLSELKGKVVLLDFTAYEGGAQDWVILLRQIYEKYHQRGLEIYQVSLDEDPHYWKMACQNLPWICVYEAQGVRSEMLRNYNVQKLPTYFLIDRNNSLVNRGEFVEDLDAEIQKLLGQ